MKKSDPAHIATDEEIAKIEKLITKEYKKAHKEVSKKCEDYFAKFAAKDAKWQEWVAQGTKTQKEYKEWRQGQMLVGKKWEDLRDTLAQDYTNAAQITMSITKGFAPEVYAINHNYATFEVEKKSLIDTSYTLYSKETVEHMYKGKPKLYHTYGKAVAKEIKEGKQYAWDRRRITSVLTQAVLQGESIPKITKRLEQVTAGDHKAAIRNARTMMTGVQNAGRIDALERAQDMGIPVKKQWLATVDGRTRHWHRELDGVAVDYDEPFKNEIGEIMFPGDPSADAANVYNCRCTILPVVAGFEIDVKDMDLRANKDLGDMTYDEWKASKKSYSNPIDLQEQKSANIQGAWWKKYGGGAAKEHKFTGAEGKVLVDKYTTEAKEQATPSFMPASSIKEAENYAQRFTDSNRFGAVGVSYDGVSVDVANIINKTIDDFFNTYNVDAFGGIIAPKGNTKLGKLVDGATAGYSPIRHSFLLNRKALKDVKTAEKALRSEREAIEGLLKHPERYDLSKLSLRVRKVVEASTVSGRATVPMTIEEVLWHELGHSLERQISKLDSFSTIKANMQFYAPKISGYATESMSEYIAESFCSYRKGEKIIDEELAKAFKQLER